MNNLETLYSQNVTLPDAFKNVASAVKKQICVADLCKIKSIQTPFNSTYGVALAEPFAVTNENANAIIPAYFFKSTLAVNDIVLLVYTDIDFRAALKINSTAALVGSPNYHLKSFAVAIPLT